MKLGGGLLVLAAISLSEPARATEDQRGTELVPPRFELRVISLPAIVELDPSTIERIADAEDWVRELDGESPQLGEAYGSLGRVYLAHAFDLAARESFVNATRLEPGKFLWQYYLGYAAIRTGDLEAASKALENALDLRSDDLPAKMRLADTYHRSNRPGDAKVLLEQILERAPDHAYARSELGKIALEERNWSEGIRHLEAALELQPQATSLYNPLALAYRQQGDRERAAELLEKRGPGALSMADPLLEQANELASGTQLLLHKGSVATRQGRFEEALRAFEEAVRADPGNPVAHYNVGALKLQIGETDEAIAEFQEAVRLDPEYLKARQNLGTVLSRVGRHEEALEQLQQALEIDPEDAATRQNLANALRRADRCAQALPHYRWLFDRDPLNEAGWLGSVRCLSQAGDSAAALAANRDGLRALPDSRRLRESVVRLLAASPDAEVRDGSEAVIAGESLFAESPGVGTAVALAMAYAELGRFEDAVRVQKMAVEGARRGRRTDVLPGLEESLLRYERHEPCRDPWR